MPTARYKTTINAPFERLTELLADKVDKPRKYIGAVLHSKILERNDGYVLREMFQPVPVEITIREKIYEQEVAGGVDYVFEHLDNPKYTGAFHNILTRVEGRDDAVELEYFMDWRPQPGVPDEISPEVAAVMVRDGVEHMKHMAENPVEVPDWVRDFFLAADSMVPESLEPLLAEDVHFRIGNNVEVIGRKNVVEASRGLAKVFSDMQHDYVGVHHAGDRTFVDCFVDYTAHNGDQYLIPFMTMLERKDDQIALLHAYGDMSPIRHGW